MQVYDPVNAVAGIADHKSPSPLATQPAMADGCVSLLEPLQTWPDIQVLVSLQLEVWTKKPFGSGPMGRLAFHFWLPIDVPFSF